VVFLINYKFVLKLLLLNLTRYVTVIFTISEILFPLINFDI